MKEVRIEEMINRRERGYIWLEKELKRNLAISTAGIITFFLIIYWLGLKTLCWWLLFVAAVLVNGIWCYLMYRRKYRDYLSIVRYLEEFEAGNYQFRAGDDYLRCGIHSQITEQLERMGNAFGTLKKRLTDEKENTKSLVTDISHQLKTPVAALGISLELLEDEQITENEKQEFLGRSKKEVEKLKYLMESLTNLSRLETDMIQLAPREASLKKTLLRAVNGIYMKAEEKQIEIELEEFTDMELLHDPRWTAEAFSNVLDNAVKYSPRGSKIQIRIKPQISYVFIEVKDEGIGILKSDYQNIFKRFYRGDRPEVEAAEGAGVGLYLVRQILEEQGGSIRALAAHGNGTVIQMTLPKPYALEK